MCGILGCTDRDTSKLLNELQAMLPLMAHRGPDGSGIWIDTSTGVGLGHARLAIVDLSPEGHQPKISKTGRYVVTFNGEVFNYRELAKELTTLGHAIVGSGDTEVMLAAFEEWGIVGATTRFIGMFAFGVWDREHQELTLIRDRFGIKPLYYGWISNGGLLFTSDLHSLRGHSRWQGNLERSAIAQMVSLGYVPCSQSVYTNFYKLPGGTSLTISGDALFKEPPEHSSIVPMEEAIGASLHPVPYWSAAEKVLEGSRTPFKGTFQEAVIEYERHLHRSLSLRMLADVPVGAFLSGGVDSSLVVAGMQRLSSKPVRTFCIGSHDPEFDESGYARDVANHLGTDHSELRLSETDLLSVIEKLPRIYDEPFGDSSQIPTFLVSQLARSQVTVALSGDGGDEMFCGYSRFKFTANFWRRISPYPRAVRVLTVPLRALLPSIAKCAKMYRLASKIDRVLQLFPNATLRDLYECALRFWERDSGVVQDIPLIHTVLPDIPELLPDAETFLMFADTVTYLPDDILTKVDRASMAVSLEARVPLLDHHLTEFVWTLPTNFKIAGQDTPQGSDTTKRVMRELLYTYVPRHLIDRPKKGFSIPIHRWLRSTLRTWAEDLLSPAELSQEGIFDPSVVQAYLQEHMQGARDRDGALWNILQCRSWIKGLSTTPTSLRLASTPVVVFAAPYHGRIMEGRYAN